MTYIEELTAIRRKHHVSQKELGILLGVSHAAISDMELGKTNITIGRLTEWCEALNVRVDISFWDKND